MVRTLKLSDGKTIPGLAWGNGTSGLQKSGPKAVELGALALKAGILHIDTAQVGPSPSSVLVWQLNPCVRCTGPRPRRMGRSKRLG